MNPDNPYYKPVPLSERPRDQQTPFYDVTHLAEADFRFRAVFCPVCNWSEQFGFEGFAVLCTPSNRIEFKRDTGIFRRIYRWVTRKSWPTCPLKGVHKHYRCVGCGSRFVVNVGDLRLKGNKLLALPR